MDIYEGAFAAHGLAIFSKQRREKQIARVKKLVPTLYFRSQARRHLRGLVRYRRGQAVTYPPRCEDVLVVESRSSAAQPNGQMGKHFPDLYAAC